MLTGSAEIADSVELHIGRRIHIGPRRPLGQWNIELRRAAAETRQMN